MRKFIVSLLVLAVLTTVAGVGAPATGAQAGLSGSIIYITQDKGGTLYAYQEGSWSTPVATYTGLPITNGVRGITAKGDVLYISSGGAGGSTGKGGVTAWNMVTHKTVWHTNLTSGVDLLSICPNGKLYVPQGEDAVGDPNVTVMDAATGTVTGAVKAPADEPHDSVCMPSGGLYLEAKQSTSLLTPKGLVGPGPNAVRPFTVSASEAQVYMTYTKFRGFAVGSTSTGKITATHNFGSIPSTYKISAPSHGISLNPDGSDVWVLDSPVGQVEEWTATATPSHVATVKLNHKDTGTEANCAADCSKSGWLLNTLDGKYVLVGDSGDVISTSTHSVVGFIPALANNRHGYLEVDWSGGSPVATSTHVGVGH